MRLLPWQSVRFGFVQVAKSEEQSRYSLQWLKEYGGQALRQYRDKRGLTQKQLAEELGVTSTYLSQIEIGRMQLSLALAAKIGGKI